MKQAMFTKAIVRTPGHSFIDGLTAHPELGKPDYKLAIRQHEAYVKALEHCGLLVQTLPAQEEFPDSCFVEDVAVCTTRFALITRPGADTRRGEISGIRGTLSSHFNRIEEINAPGTIEGGDVMMVGEHFYVGLSSRTNADGAAQFIAALERNGYTGQGVTMPKTLHLKTGCSYMEENVLLVDNAFAEYEEFKSFIRIGIDPSESYAANCLRINDFVIVPAGYPKALAAIKAVGMKTIELDMSEFKKVDGGLSCLSLRI